MSVGGRGQEVRWRQNCVVGGSTVSKQSGWWSVVVGAQQKSWLVVVCDTWWAVGQLPKGMWAVRLSFTNQVGGPHFFLLARKKSIEVCFFSPFASCKSVLMPRRGWRAVKVPEGWLQVIRGPRPASVRWPRVVGRRLRRWIHLNVPWRHVPRGLPVLQMWSAPRQLRKFNGWRTPCPHWGRTIHSRNRWLWLEVGGTNQGKVGFLPAVPGGNDQVWPRPSLARPSLAKPLCCCHVCCCCCGVCCCVCCVVVVVVVVLCCVVLCCVVLCCVVLCCVVLCCVVLCCVVLCCVVLCDVCCCPNPEP